MALETQSHPNVTIFFFASLREAAQRDKLSLKLPRGEVRLSAIPKILEKEFPSLETVFSKGKNIHVALNHQICREDVTVKTGDVIAYFPPMTGG